MDNWQIFFDESKILYRLPEAAIGKFIFILEEKFDERPLNIWDNCCGAGRHALYAAMCGHKAYASDGSPTAIDLTQKAFDNAKKSVDLKKSDMTSCPWPDLQFHGVIAWDALHHNVMENIQKAVNTIEGRLCPGGLFVGSLKSDKADSYGFGREIEPKTFVQDGGNEKNIPHHYFDEREVKELFKNWEIISLAEQIVNYIQRCDNYLKENPFSYTGFHFLVRKRKD
jgi:SAM-dependent methyltransferase